MGATTCLQQFYASLTDIFYKKSAIGTAVYKLSIWGMKSYDPILTSYFRSTICLKFYTDKFIDIGFVKLMNQMCYM